MLTEATRFVLCLCVRVSMEGLGTACLLQYWQSIGIYSKAHWEYVAWQGTDPTLAMPAVTDLA